MQATLRVFIQIIVAATVFFGTGLAFSYDPKDVKQLAHETPEAYKDVGIEDTLGTFVDLALPFKDEDGNEVTLGQYFSGQKPVLLSIIYYECPSLCNFHLNGVMEGLNKLKFQAGQDYELVTVSMNPKETPALAGSKKVTYMEEYNNKDSAENGWHFLTGSVASVEKLTKQIGFKYKWDEKTQQYAHASAAYFLTPGGKISRILPGIEFDPKTMEMAFMESSSGKIGTIVDQIVMFCFQFDPSKNKYTLYAFNVMRLAGILIVLALSILLIPAWMREKKQQPGV